MFPHHFIGVGNDREKAEPVKRRVALKIIKLGMDIKQVVARFEAERQALAMMDHPNIAKVLDAGTTEGSAGWQPAVSPTGSRQGVAGSEALDLPGDPQAGSPAIQQTGSLRYGSNIRAGRPYFVMELVRGIRITDYCDQAQRHGQVLGHELQRPVVEAALTDPAKHLGKASNEAAGLVFVREFV